MKPEPKPHDDQIEVILDRINIMREELLSIEHALEQVQKQNAQPAVANVGLMIERHK